MDIFAFPIKFDGGIIKKVTHNTNDYFSQLLTLAILTEPQIHPITPEFGTLDPTFKTIERGQFITQAARFVPEIIVTDVNINLNVDEKVLVNFSFRKR